MTAGIVLAGLVAGSLLQGEAASASPIGAVHSMGRSDLTSGPTSLRTAGTDPLGQPSDGAVPTSKRARVLGKDWASSSDVAVTTAGDAQGLHILLAQENSGYGWRQIATLGVPGVDTDSWIGNSCLMQNRLAVVYGPRSATNNEEQMREGGWAAVIDLPSGTVHPLGRGYTLAYFDPGCGVHNTFTLTRFTPTGTWIGSESGTTAAAATVFKLTGQATSAIPGPAGSVYVARADSIQRLRPNADPVQVATTPGFAYDLALDGHNNLAWAEARGASATARYLAAAEPQHAPSTLVEGSTKSLGLAATTAGQVRVFGANTRRSTWPPDFEPTQEKPNGTLSSEGHLYLQQAYLRTKSEDDATLSVQARNLRTRAAAHFDVQIPTSEGRQSFDPSGSGSGSGSNAAKTSAQPAATTGGSAPYDDSARACAVSRNDPHSQVFQPRPAQVEWAVDRAVSGTLTTSRPANWNNLGMPAYTPQGLFPRTALVGGGHIPAQILLGVINQESNLLQASPLASPGETGNPLIANYYGNNTSASDSDTSLWTVSFSNADCGYGVGQITDGMLLQSGTNTPTDKQRAIALDYQANIAAAQQILAQKWNDTRNAGLIVNNGDSSKIENWFFAVWAYNTGLHAKTSDGSPWGVGWSNNPVNPIYPPNRGSFLDGTPADAAHPANWPYPEKVMGFAANSEYLLDSASANNASRTYTQAYVSGYTPAYWNGDAMSGPQNRTLVKPPRTLFCATGVNQCDPSTSAACQRSDLECWWNKPATWKTDCATTCGNEYTTYSSSAATPADATSFAPNCGTKNPPSKSMIVDDSTLLVAGTTTSYAPIRAGCSQPSTTSGSFAFSFQSGGNLGNSYPAQIDLHQLGSGYNDHFWFAHVRNAASTVANHSQVTGTWTLGSSLTSWTRVFVHLPDHAAFDQDAQYAINDGAGTTEIRSLPQRNYANLWVPLGVFKMNGTPSVSLSNVSQALPSSLNGSVDVAWDAVAFQPLPAKPTDFIVALGDSYSSGEGAGGDSGQYFNASSDNLSRDPQNDACHRSSLAWSRKATSTRVSGSTIGTRADNLDPTLDYQLIACSGATTSTMLPSDSSKGAGQGRFLEANELDAGYLDNNTTLVTLTIGGNDVGFGPVAATCITKPTSCSAQEPGVDQRISALSMPLQNVLTTIHSKAPNAKILLFGYPQIFEHSGGGTETITCGALTTDGQASLVREDTALDQQLSSVAGKLPTYVKYADPTNLFLGKSACYNSGAAINPLLLPITPGDDGNGTLPWPGADPTIGPSQQSLHPNDQGTSLYATLMNSSLSGWY